MSNVPVQPNQNFMGQPIVRNDIGANTNNIIPEQQSNENLERLKVLQQQQLILQQQAQMQKLQQAQEQLRQMQNTLPQQIPTQVQYVANKLTDLANDENVFALDKSMPSLLPQFGNQPLAVPEQPKKSSGLLSYIPEHLKDPLIIVLLCFVMFQPLVLDYLAKYISHIKDPVGQISQIGILLYSIIIAAVFVVIKKFVL